MASDSDNCGRSPFINRNKVDEGEGEGAGGSVVDEYYRGTHAGRCAWKMTLGSGSPALCELVGL